MGLLTFQRESRATSNPSAYHPRDPALADLWGYHSKSGQTVNANTALRVSTVYACTDILSQTLAMLPKTVKEMRPDGGFNILPKHRVYKLIHDRPNRWQSDFEFFYMMEGHRLLRGNAYSKIVSNPGRAMNELVPMHPDHIWPFVITPNGSILYLDAMSPSPPAGSKLYYRHFPANAPDEILLAEEVMHIKAFPSNNPIIGISPISKYAASEAVGLAMAIEEQGSRLFSNGAQIPYGVKYPGRVDDITYERMKKEVTEKIQGVHNFYRPFFLEEGMDIVKLGLTMVDAQYLELRGFQVEDIARIFHVPLMLLQHGDKAPTYASAEQFMISFKIATMQPNVVRWESGMNKDLLFPSEIDKLKIDIDLDEIMRGDAAARATYLQRRFQTASISPNDIRRYEGENPSDDDGADKLYIMNNMVQLKDAGSKYQKNQGLGK